jgi:MoaA/NifB/PqqE/SkfB family radical SAM enzyme
MTSVESRKPPGIISRFHQRYREIAVMKPPVKGISAYVNWIRSNFEIRAGASTIKARPWKITFDPTNVCQLRCPLCPTGLQVQDRPSGHAQLHMFEHLLDEVGDYLFFVDFFNWGEPLLNTHIEDFIRLAAAKKIVSSMSTNLSLPLTDERIRRIVTSGLNEILVSLDGASPDTYATYRRLGKFELVCSNIRRIVEEKRRLGQTHPLVTWQFLVFRFNEHEIEKAKAMAQEMGVDRLLFRPPFLDVDRFPLPAGEKLVMLQWETKDTRFRIVPDDRPHSRCGWHYMSSAINWDGTVAPCCTTFETRDDFGTIGKSGDYKYMDVINNAAFRSVRERFSGGRKDPVPLICEKCPTPSIMGYHKYINHQVILFTIVGLVQAVQRFFGGASAGRSETLEIPATPPALKQPNAGAVD